MSRTDLQPTANRKLVETSQEYLVTMADVLIDLDERLSRRHRSVEWHARHRAKQE
jgi:hypothetical protein